MASDGSERPLADEVRLVGEVKECRTCKFFWGEVPPYGPYPAYDVKERYPEGIRRHLPQSDGTVPIRWLQARAIGERLVEPAIMQGCRKAPIMTIGINPNLTPFFGSADGATWAYPHFADAASYAYAYRHGSVFQTSYTRTDVVDHLLPDGRVIARADGESFTVERRSSHRWMLLKLKYKDGTDEDIEVSWSPAHRAVIVADGRAGFKAGDVLCGYLDAPEDTDVTLFARGSGYNQRFLHVLWRFQALIGGPLAAARLEIGEDVGQNDMIACASPGWTDKYDIPTKRVTHNCVEDHAYVIRQFLQSRPAVLVLVSASAVEMFQPHCPGEFGLEIKHEDRLRNDFDLLQETTRERRYITVDRDGVRFRTRILVSPHFSYADNFAPQSRFTGRAWDAFRAAHPADAELLVARKRVDTDYQGINTNVTFDGADDPLARELTPAALQALLERHVAAFDLLAGALAEEYRDGVLAFDPRTGHLARSDGPCRFCVNERWQFPEGCAYGRCP